VFPATKELGFYIPENGVLHSHRCENLRSCRLTFIFAGMICRKFEMQSKCFVATYIYESECLNYFVSN
jgi:hypothetical protein